MRAAAPKEMRFLWRCSKVIKLMTSLGESYVPLSTRADYAFRWTAIRKLEHQRGWLNIAITLKTPFPGLAGVHQCYRLLSPFIWQPDKDRHELLAMNRVGI
jgi:hypothetical protein